MKRLFLSKIGARATSRLVARAVNAVTGMALGTLMMLINPPTAGPMWAFPVLFAVSWLLDVRSPGRLGLVLGLPFAGIWLWFAPASVPDWQYGVLGMVAAAWLWTSASAATGPVYAELSGAAWKFLALRGGIWLAVSAVLMVATLAIAGQVSNWTSAGWAAMAVAVAVLALLAALLGRPAHDSAHEPR